MTAKLSRMLAICVLLISCGIQGTSQNSPNGEMSGAPGESIVSKKVIKNEEEWKQELTTEQFQILRKSGTEHAFTGKLNAHYEKGLYLCAGCGSPLFTSDTKYDHGTGWPSFTTAVDENNIHFQSDRSLFIHRTEVRCAVCDGHLGHIFDDGPPAATKIRSPH